MGIGDEYQRLDASRDISVRSLLKVNLDIFRDRGFYHQLPTTYFFSQTIEGLTYILGGVTLDGSVLSK